MSNQLTSFINEQLPSIEKRLVELVEILPAPTTLKESMLYSLKAGGKRVRPLYVLAVAKSYDVDLDQALTVGAAVEMIHTYSLIHDDLPCMDDDSLRRGKPTNHVVFGEDIATLAGDALNTLAFGVIARMQGDAEMKVELVNLLSQSAGAEGMVGGQVLDMEGEKRNLALEELENIHVNKTGAILRFSIEAGAVLAGASKLERQALSTYGHHIGLAFQIQDDILDVTATSEQLGKTAGKDLVSEKSTYPSLLTVEGAKQKLEEHYEAAILALKDVSFDPSLLIEFAQFIVKRDH